MSFWEQAGQVLLRDRATSSQNRDAMQRLTLHGINQGQQLHLRHVSQGLGIDPATQPYLKPYGVEQDVNVTNNYVPPAPIPPAAPAPTSGVLKGMAVAGLMAAGLGTAGIGGYYAIDKALSGLPAKVATSPAPPQQFDIGIKFDADKGLQVGPAVPVKGQ